MGRGKSKAKQTKVARELKYGSSESDLGALEAELGVERTPLHSQEEDLGLAPQLQDESSNVEIIS